MMPVNLNDKLTELEWHLATASKAEKQRANPRLQRLLADLNHDPRHRAATRDDTAAEEDLFDNVPV